MTEHRREVTAMAARAGGRVPWGARGVLALLLSQRQNTWNGKSEMASISS